MPQPERETATLLEWELVQRFADVFIPRWDQYPVQLPHGKYVQLQQPLTPDLVRAHLEDYRYPGRPSTTLGAYALDPASQAKWICFDADTPETWQHLKQLADHLLTRAVMPYLEHSRRGGHLWLFLPTPLPGADARRFGQQLLTSYTHTDVKAIELYPKQDQLLDGAGSFVRLPFGVHQKSNRVYHFVTLDGQPIAPTIREQIGLLSNPQRIPPAFVAAALDNRPKPSFASPTPTFEKRSAVAGEPLSETLKRTISVHEFISRFVHLDQHGRGLCPFHDDHHPSFQVNLERNYWSCYAGCGGGSIIDFYMKWRETHGQDGSFTATIKDLRSMLLT
jgi:hypothetical protein